MPNIVCPNDDPGLNLTYFCNSGLSIETFKTVDFLEFAACDLKVGICLLHLSIASALNPSIATVMFYIISSCTNFV